MINSTLYGVRNAGEALVPTRVSVKAIFNKLVNTKKYRLLFAAVLLVLCSTGNSAYAFTTTYDPSSASAGAGGTYCVGNVASDITGSIFTTGTLFGTSSSTVTWSWYYNTTGATGTLAGATLVPFVGGTYTAGAATGVADLPGTSISTATPGTYYYFLYVSYFGGSFGTGDLYSNLATVTVNTSGTITGPTSVCTGFTIALTDAAGGGTWSSSNPAVGSVSATGVVDGLTAGTTTISYNTTCGPATSVITVLQTPSAITGPSTVCASGGFINTITLSDADGGGTWSSTPFTTATAIASGVNTGLVTGISAGTATITYTWTNGCTVNTVVTVQPLPGPISGVLTACTGTAVTLSDPAAPGGTWTSGTPAVATIDPVSGILVMVAPGTSVITYTTACDTVQAIVTSVGVPEPIASYGDSACVNASTVFADVTLGGTWISSNSSIASVLPTDGIITGVSAGTAVITYSIPPGCFTTRIVTINALPPAITGNLPICPGTSVTLHDAVAGTWSSMRNFVAGVATTTGVVTGVSADTATVVFSTTKGCKATTVVTVNPAPVAITGGNIPCGLSVDTVYDGTPGGTWSSSNTTIATIGAASGIITTLAGGTTVITYKLSGTGCIATKVLTVNPAPAPIVTYNFVTNSFFTDTFYTSYQWYSDAEGQILGAVSFRTAALYDGHYWLVVVDTNGCVGTSIHVLYNSAMVGVQNTTDNNSVRIYPNPASNVLNIESAVNVRAVITGIDGKTEMEQVNAKELNIGALANGMYFISLYNDSGERIVVQKLIKQ